jgi:hypothetical protein
MTEPNPSFINWTNGEPTQEEVRHQLRTGDVYAIVGTGDSEKHSMFRLIHKNSKTNKAWVIEIPTDAKSKQHVKAPTDLALSELTELLKDNKIAHIQLVDAPIYTMSDEEIRRTYTNKNGDCTVIDYRNIRYGILETLTSHHSTAEILERGLAAKWTKEQATITGKSRAKLYDILHTYWAGNFSKNALLPEYWRSGGKGKEREQKRKLGRPNAKARSDVSANKGYFLSEDDKKKLRLGWKYFLNEGKTRWQAYLQTMAIFYSERWEIRNGEEDPILLPPDSRPTFAQFETWGRGGDPRLTASRIQLGEIDWNKKYRGISGSAKDGIAAVGVQAVCDTTTNDVYLKSVVSRLKTVGPVNRLLITESRSDIIFGIHVDFGAPSARTFLLAVAQGALNKVDFCARFGITIKEDEWPALAARTYLGDNGEYRNEESREALDQFGASVDSIPAGQPQYNGVAESKHHLLHARLDHTLPGTTHGQPRKRGQPHPAINACVNYYEYMRELIREILYHNNEEPTPHLLTVEMRRAQVKPTRIAIYRWLVENGYIVDFTPDIAILRAHLYPSHPATLTESGVYLLRQDCGDKEEVIPNARYMGDCLISLGLLEQARRKGNRRIMVRCNPMDPRSVWIQTKLGLAALENIHPDPILYRQAPLADLLSIKEEDKLVELENRQQDEQGRASIMAGRQSMVNRAQAEKSSEISALPKPMKKADHSTGIDENRKNEIAFLSAQAYSADPYRLQSERIPTASEDDAHTAVAWVRQAESTQSKPSKNIPEDALVNPALRALINYTRERDER